MQPVTKKKKKEKKDAVAKPVRKKRRVNANRSSDADSAGESDLEPERCSDNDEDNSNNNDDDSDSGDDDDGGDDDDSDKDMTLGCPFVNLDGKVFPVQTSNVSHVLKRACYSSKTGTSGLQTLVWSMPCGIPIIVTGLFAARLSEPRQVELHSRWLSAIPAGVSILEDRGFRRLQHCYPKYVLVPG